ncbi:hypothetical protein EC973_007165 [Apophysomyces ossiformis]|uniref:C3H1-type domain-containing protein n=1 Tax=Apophysomyces ossiformis TaxID=679940 RepID=A0A8H7ET27_9FUNG|nr:hypothetical protein EC973_007165 [Apophysomyces ossiformis]
MGSVAVITVGSILYLSLFRERKGYEGNSRKPTKSKSREIQPKAKVEKPPVAVDVSTTRGIEQDTVVAQVEQSQKEVILNEKEIAKKDTTEATINVEEKTDLTESAVIVEKEETTVVETEASIVETERSAVVETTEERSVAEETIAENTKEAEQAVAEPASETKVEDQSVKEVVSAIVSEVQDTLSQDDSAKETDAEWSAILPSEETAEKEAEKKESISAETPSADETKASSPAPSQTSSSSSSTENAVSLTPGDRTQPKTKNQSAIRTSPYATTSNNNNNNVGYYWGQPSQYKSDWAQLFTLPQQQADMNSHSYYSRSIPSLPSAVDVLPDAQYEFTPSKKKRMSRPEQIEQQRQTYIPPMKSRCIYWPSCTNKNCKFAHPTKQCREGDNCTYGERCMFLHARDMEQPTRPARNQQARRSRSRTTDN